MSEIENYYNEEKWLKFSSLFKSNEKTEWKTLNRIFENDDRLTNVIFEQFGVASLNWIEQKVPALNDLTPKECLKTEKLKQRLKESLMRMDW